MDKEKDNNELDLSNLNLEELDNNEIEALNNDIPTEIDLDSLEESEEIIPTNMILEDPDDLTLGLTPEQITEFYEYLGGKRARPVFAERFFADSDARIRESNQLTTLMSLSFVPKLLAMQQSIINSLSTPESLKYLSVDEKISYLQTLTGMSTKFNEAALKYTQAVRDFSGVPLVYRQLLDQLLMIPGDKLSRLKVIPKLVDLSDDVWNRIIEIADVKE